MFGMRRTLGCRRKIKTFIKKVKKNNIFLNNYSSSNLAVAPIKRYENALLSKNTILTENKNKSGIYH